MNAEDEIEAATGSKQERARSRLALALDVASAGEATALARRLRPHFSVVKVGLELFVAEGPDVVRALTGEGFDVFLDLKLHDIPNTVGRAAARAGGLGVRYLTVHLAGGEQMVRAAVEGFASASPGARGSGILGVTVLTSEPEAGDEVLAERARLAASAGCVGAVCASADLPVVRPAATGLVLVVPGIRMEGSDRGDQARIATPGSALASGADLLVIGRTVTAAADPEAAAALVSASLLGGSWQQH